MKTDYLNIRGQLVSLSSPLVMGIVNVTDDSFYSDSRTYSPTEVMDRIKQMVDEGVDILDIGGYSSRPGAAEITHDEEYRRLAIGLEAASLVAPEVAVSIDTFRADVVKKCVTNWNVDIINDISGGTIDPDLWPTVAELHKAYVLMHLRGNPQTMTSLTDYHDVTAAVLTDLSKKLRELHLLGVNDVIVDPGLGFAKTLTQNYQLLRELRAFESLDAPILVGISRKSMIYKLLDITPAESLSGTIALNMAALMNSANILRVHDVRAAVETVKIFNALQPI